MRCARIRLICQLNTERDSDNPERLIDVEITKKTLNAASTAAPCKLNCFTLKYCFAHTMAALQRGAKKIVFFALVNR